MRTEIWKKVYLYENTYLESYFLPYRFSTPTKIPPYVSLQARESSAEGPNNNKNNNTKNPPPPLLTASVDRGRGYTHLSLCKPTSIKGTEHESNDTTKYLPPAALVESGPGHKRMSISLYYYTLASSPTPKEATSDALCRQQGWPFLCPICKSRLSTVIGPPRGTNVVAPG